MFHVSPPNARHRLFRGDAKLRGPASHDHHYLDNVLPLNFLSSPTASTPGPTRLHQEAPTIQRAALPSAVGPTLQLHQRTQIINGHFLHQGQMEKKGKKKKKKKEEEMMLVVVVVVVVVLNCSDPLTSGPASL
ncbi:hypothetical protein CRUP_021942 [Coryphaenoides rupestris]|nr:hypothetical protein CRUP_021942 [Coryphaenoides rupestris]